MSSCWIENVDPKAACSCGDCDWTGPAERLEMISDIQERIDAGSTVPAGECPECGALAYVDDVEPPADALDALRVLATWGGGQGMNPAHTEAMAKARAILDRIAAPPAPAPAPLGRMVQISARALRLLIDTAAETLDDWRSGVKDGTYEADLLGSIDAIETAAKEAEAAIAAPTQDPARVAAVLALAADAIPWKDGELEEADASDAPGAMISEGDDNGAYIRAWVWLSFEGTPLDKEREPVAAEG